MIDRQGRVYSNTDEPLEDFDPEWFNFTDEQQEIQAKTTRKARW